MGQEEPESGDSDPDMVFPRGSLFPYHEVMGDPEPEPQQTPDEEAETSPAEPVVDVVKAEPVVDDRLPFGLPELAYGSLVGGRDPGAGETMQSEADLIGGFGAADPSVSGHGIESGSEAQEPSGGEADPWIAEDAGDELVLAGEGLAGADDEQSELPDADEEPDAPEPQASYYEEIAPEDVTFGHPGDGEDEVADDVEEEAPHAAEDETEDEDEAEETEPVYELPRPEAPEVETDDSETEAVPSTEEPYQAELFSSSDYDSKTLRAAADLVIKSRRAEVTFLQRRLRIGFDGAMILLDELRNEGIVGGELGSPKGILLIDPEVWGAD